jgi:hypothetical protein
MNLTTPEFKVSVRNHAMRKLLFSAAVVGGLILFADQAPAGYLALDQFDYSPVGSPLSGHDGWGLVTNAAGSPDPTIANGSLSHPDRLPNLGNSAQLVGTGASGSSKLPLSSLQSTGTVYYSMLVNVNNIANLTDTANGSYLAGFNPNNLVSPAVTSVTTGGANLLIHRDTDNPNAYNLGIAASAGGAGNDDRVFDTTELVQGQTVFVVAAYLMNPDPNDDQAFLWINPSPLTYGAAIAPAPNLTSNGASTVANDHGPVSSFYFRNNGVQPDGMQADDLRVATTWEEVTSLEIPEPAGIASAIAAVLGLLGRRRR